MGCPRPAILRYHASEWVPPVRLEQLSSWDRGGLGLYNCEPVGIERRALSPKSESQGSSDTPQVVRRRECQDGVDANHYQGVRKSITSLF